MTEPVQRAREQEQEGAAGGATRRTEPLCRLDRTARGPAGELVRVREKAKELAGEQARAREKAKEIAGAGSNINLNKG